MRRADAQHAIPVPAISKRGWPLEEKLVRTTSFTSCIGPSVDMLCYVRKIAPAILVHGHSQFWRLVPQHTRQRMGEMFQMAWAALGHGPLRGRRGSSLVRVSSGEHALHEIVRNKRRRGREHDFCCSARMLSSSSSAPPAQPLSIFTVPLGGASATCRQQRTFVSMLLCGVPSGGAFLISTRGLLSLTQCRLRPVGVWLPFSRS